MGFIQASCRLRSVYTRTLCILPSSLLIGRFVSRCLSLADTIWSTNPPRPLIGGRKAETPQLWKQQSTTQLVDREGPRDCERSKTCKYTQVRWWNKVFGRCQLSFKWTKHRSRHWKLWQTGPMWQVALALLSVSHSPPNFKCKVSCSFYRSPLFISWNWFSPISSV